LAITDCFETLLVSIERSFQGLSGAVETMGIVKELMEIWPNEVCDNYTVTAQYLQEVWNRRRVVYYAILLLLI